MKKTALRTQLFGGIGLLALLLLLSAAVSLVSLRDSQARLDRLYADRIVPLRQLKLIADAYAVSIIDAVNKADAGLLTPRDALVGIEDARRVIAE